MRLPVTLEEFLALFASYNEAVRFAPLLLSLLALAAAAAALLRGGAAVRIAGRKVPTGRVVSGLLAVLALWTGIVYHWAFFTRINQAAWVFGALFVLEGALLVWFGVRHGGLDLSPRADSRGMLGGAVMLYALVIYPMVGAGLGHRYPAAPTFGAPCPTTLFLIGMLLWSDARVVTRRRLLILLGVPVLWAAIGTAAAIELGMREDLALPLAAAAALLLAIRSAPPIRAPVTDRGTRVPEVRRRRVPRRRGSGAPHARL
jgi:hypothetical protein